MTTKKITLNELRSLVKHIIKEEFNNDLKNKFKNINDDNETVKYVKDNILSDKKYKIKYGGPGMPIDDYNKQH